MESISTTFISFDQTMLSCSVVADSSSALIASTTNLYFIDLYEGTAQELILEKSYSDIFCITCHPSALSKEVFAISSKTCVDIWTLDSSLHPPLATLSKSITISDTISKLVWNEQAENLLAGYGTIQKVYVWDTGEGKILGSYQSPGTQPINSICWLKNTENLLAISKGNSISLWNTKTNEPFSTSIEVDGPITSLDSGCAFSQGKIMMYSYSDTIVLYNIETRTVEVSEVYAYPVTLAKFSPDGTKVYHSNGSNVWESKIYQAEGKWTLESIRTFNTDSGLITYLGIASTDSGQILVAMRSDNRLILWKSAENYDYNTLNEDETEGTDPFNREVKRIEELPPENVGFLDLSPEKRKLLLKVKATEDLWVTLSISVPYLYPMYLSPLIKIAGTSKVPRSHKKDMLARLREIATKSVINHTLCIKEIVQYVLSDLQDPGKYPSISKKLNTKISSTKEYEYAG